MGNPRNSQSPIELSCESELDVLEKVSISLESEFDPENQFKGYPLEPKSDHLAPTWADLGPLGVHLAHLGPTLADFGPTWGTLGATIYRKTPDQPPKRTLC